MNQSKQTFTNSTTDKCLPSGIVSNQRILALSWNIATEPTLYKKLATNPYDCQVMQFITKRFPDFQTIDVITAIILAEPEGKYDRNFKLSEPAKQTKMLYDQEKISNELQQRLIHYGTKHMTTFSQLSKDFVYANLSILVFKTADIQKIEQSYSQQQRKTSKLAIIDFIEAKPKSMSPHQNTTNPSTNNPSDKKPSTKRSLLQSFFVLLPVIAFFMFCINQYGKYIEQQPIQNRQETKQTLGSNTQKETKRLPIRLKIPSIAVDAAIEYVKVTSNGTMEVPKDTINVGWFALGPIPGEKGSAVIAGHFNTENGGAGVFAQLHKLKEGDKLYVEDATGTSIAFVVRESRTYNPGYADHVFSQNAGTHLNLITCDGVWDATKKSYSKRLVVFTDIAR